MGTALQYVFGGVTLGAVYAIAALGLTLVYKVSGVIYFAQGSAIAFAAFIAISVNEALDTNPVVLLLISSLAGALGSVAAFILFIRPVLGRDLSSMITITMAVALILEGLMLKIWGGLPRTLPPLSGGRPFEIGGAYISRQAVATLVVAAIAAALFAAFLRHTVIGKSLQACGEDRVGAEVCGVTPSRMILIAFAISGLLTGAGAALITPVAGITFASGGPITLYVLTAVIIGGLSSNAGAFVGGLALGIAQSVVNGIYPQYADALTYSVLILILMFRPQGLLAGRAS